MVIIHKRDPARPVLGREPSLRRHVLKLALAQIPKQQYRVVQRNGQIVQSIAVIVAHRAGYGMS